MHSISLRLESKRCSYSANVVVAVVTLVCDRFALEKANLIQPIDKLGKNKTISDALNLPKSFQF